MGKGPHYFNQAGLFADVLDVFGACVEDFLTGADLPD